MRKIVFALFLATISLAAAPASANECAQVALDVAAKYRAEVLAARLEAGQCVIKLRIPGENGQPPRVETIAVPS